MIETVSFKSLPCNIESCDFSMHDRDSSTVEAEDEIQLHSSLRSHQEPLLSEHTDYDFSKDNTTKTRLLCASKWKSEACLLGTENFQSKLKPNSRKSNQNKIPVLKYKWHFQIEKNNPNIDIRSVKVIHDSNIIIAERSKPRILIYKTSGFQLSELPLQQKPEDMEIVPDNRIAVTVKKSVLIIDVTNLKDIKIANEITLQKSCHGVAFMNQTLFVNCLNGDLVVMTLDGSIVQKHLNYQGIWFIAGKDGTLLTVKRNSDLVNFFNLSTKQWSYSRCPWLFGASGIETDTNGNIFITCDYSNRVYMYHRRLSQWTFVLDEESSIDCPRGIAYDAFTNDIAVVNNAGKSVYVFKMT
ncbi:uncharacterized protein [Mytilus edulis]|uniref:uncharacterized protein n=1 Tax=Mytilus edulis TaxID=6550 RepID=UPI0039F057F1